MPPRNKCGSSCNFGVVSGERIFLTSSGSTRLHGQLSSHTEEIREELGGVKDQLRTPQKG